VVEEAPLGFADPVLKKIIGEFDLRKVPVSAVINANDYQIAQVQAPDVPRADLRAAARYSMRDAFDFPIDNSTLDVFDLPEQTSSGDRKMCFAIASRGDAIEKMSAVFEKNFRKFDVIDIPELCQRNLSALLPQDAKGVAFLLIRDEFAQLVLTRRGMLYVTRRFEFMQRGELNGDEEAEANELPLDPQVLSLELQRSLDYYESHFDETAIADLFIAPAGMRANLLAAELGASTGLRISMFNIHDLVDVSFSAEIPDGWLPCMAIGAALRARAG
jgi:MSHA biogenesis protein MshI